jgi:hypothetical protein
VNYPFFQSKGIDVITHLSNSILQNSNARAETTQLKLNKSIDDSTFKLKHEI